MKFILIASAITLALLLYGSLDTILMVVVNRPSVSIENKTVIFRVSLGEIAYDDSKTEKSSLSKLISKIWRSLRY